MKLYILRPVDNLPDNDNPWETWYDKAFGYIVAAETADTARALANQKGGDEKRFGDVWLDAKYTTCQELEAGDTEQVVMEDFAAA